MELFFWGTRGSLPVSLPYFKIEEKFKKIQSSKNTDLTGAPFNLKGFYGGNTSCVQLVDSDNPDEYIIFDAGTGIRDFGNSFFAPDKKKSGNIFHIFMSHLHWDHIQGFPFFTPAYIPGNIINIYGCHTELEEAFRNQHNPVCFPVPFNALQAEIKFNVLEPVKEYSIAGFRIKCIEQAHPGKSYGYSFEKKNKKIVYSTDSEHKEEPATSEFIEFYSNADALIFDAQYTLVDAEFFKWGWGHSSNLIAVEFAVLSKVKHLIMFHSEPTFTDEALDKILENTVKYAKIYAPDSPLKISTAYDYYKLDI